MPDARLRISPWIYPLLLSLLLSGCGTREYNKLVNGRVALARGEAKFRTLYAPSDVPGAPLKIRIPLVFKPDQLYVATSKHGDDGNQIRPDRFQPPFLKWSGFQYCYEGRADSTDGRKYPFYCYLGAVPGTNADAEKLAAQFTSTLKETFKDAPLDWASIDCESASGIAVQWKKLRIEADQPFLSGSGDTVTSENHPGIFEVWIAEKQNHIVVMAWRVPKAIDTPTAAPAADAAPAAGGLAALVAVQSSGAKPDTATMPILMGGTLAVDPAKVEPAGG